MDIKEIVLSKSLIALISIVIIAYLIYSGFDGALYTFLGMVLGYYFTRK